MTLHGDAGGLFLFPRLIPPPSADCVLRYAAKNSARKPSHLPPPPRSAPVGEPVTIVVVLENLLTVPVSVEDMQLVLTTPREEGKGGSEEGGEEEEVACLALDEEEFHKMSVRRILDCRFF